MSGGGRFLFVTWPGGGNVSPLVEMGLQLAERGHDVRVLAAEELRKRFGDEGLGFQPQQQPDFVGWPMTSWLRSPESQSTS